MCNQTVCLIAAEIERKGIPTVVIQLLREVTEKIRPPRALFVPFPHGYSLGAPNHPGKQHAVIEAAFGMFENSQLTPPALVAFKES